MSNFHQNCQLLAQRCQNKLKSDQKFTTAVRLHCYSFSYRIQNQKLDKTAQILTIFETN